MYSRRNHTAAMSSLVASALCLCAAQTVQAAPLANPAHMVTAENPQSIVTALLAGGYKAILTKDEDGDPKIKSAAAGVNFSIMFYGCKEHIHCKTVEFTAGWTDSSATVDFTNSWNKEHRHARVYIDSDNDPVMENDIDLEQGGMSEALFIDNVQYWETTVGKFDAALPAKEKAQPPAQPEAPAPVEAPASPNTNGTTGIK